MNKRGLHVLLFLQCIFFIQQINAQEQGFVFPIGCRVVIQLDTLSQAGTTDYQVIYYEDFSEIVDTYDNINHFFIDQPKNTIQFVFTVATHGKTRSEVEKNYRSIFLVRSRYPYELSYSAAVSAHVSEEFAPAKVQTLIPNVKNTELWQYFTDSIAIYDFGKVLRKDMEQKKIRINQSNGNSF